ncbi:calponin homology domain-containing protein DDB_G0272472-like isoform X2 [Topomyia yanbarensis]|uniref:calponin homology domain-containing protein DDB_G0272472-like isoform X2 n=1 Tax=Topomyia yanbarensis TaxID=2498891 RepID=UPI00273CA755|nr:calponin homology domain-containing protein DDB_G0272472-like isoform X2 [Topomyia yanbarensis]
MDELMKLVEVSQEETSYEEQLEYRKTLLLKQREVDDFNKIAAEIKKFSLQLRQEDQRALHEAKKTQKLCHKLDELKIEVQDIIDQNIWYAMTAMNEQCHRRTQKEKQREQKAQKICEMKEKLQKYQQIQQHFQNSKGQIMLREANEQLEEERRKLDRSRAEIESICIAKRKQEQKEWSEITTMFVQIGKLHVDIKARDKDNDTIIQNNELMKVKINLLKDEIEQRNLQEAEEVKRRENEMQERVLMPMKIVHADIAQDPFKNPNDFPALADKIDFRRQTSQNIFKRPKCIELRKYKKKNKPRAAALLNIKMQLNQPVVKAFKLPIAEKTLKLSTEQPKVTKEHSQNENSVKTGTTTKKAERVSTEKQVGIATDQRALNRVKPQADSDHTSQKKPTQPVKRKSTEVDLNNNKALPTCSVQNQQSSKRTKPSKSQPESASALKTYIPHDHSSEKRLTAHTQPASKERHQLSQMPSSAPSSVQVQKITPKHPSVEVQENVFPDAKPRTQEHKSKRQEIIAVENPNLPVSPPLQRHPAQQEADQLSDPKSVQSEGDNGSNESVSPPGAPRQHKGKDSYDAISLTSSVSSFDMETRGASSDFDFQLSPAGETLPNNTVCGDGSAGSDLDFDFLGSPQQQNPSGTSQKNNEAFDFLEADDSGAGFDFF